MRIFRVGLCFAAAAVSIVGCEANEAPPAAHPQVTPPPAESSATAVPVAPKNRLPETVRPTSYDAALTLVPTEERFEGHLTIPIEISASTPAVWLNAAGIDVRSATIDGAPAKVVPGGDQMIGLQPAQPLPAGHATVVIDYSGEISSKSEGGVFRQKSGADWYAFTQFEATDARRGFPCFDEPSFKAPWKVRLKVKKGDTALSNTPPISEKVEGDYKIVQFAETKPLPSYLVAFAVGPFDIVDAGTAGKKHTPVRIITPRGRGAEARYAKEVTGPILEQLENYFGIPYAYEKLDVLDVPVFSGAMENPGLVTYTESVLLEPPGKETVRNHHAYTDITMHEFAHQWFGDLVTTAWWDDLWLNEAFASWMTNRIIENWQPDRHKDTERASDTARAMKTDSLAHARSIRHPVASREEISDGSDSSILYEKGAAVIDMFENLVGRETFRAGVNRYLTRYAHGNATSAQFLSTVFDGENAKIIPAFESFLNQPGVPLVSAGLKCEAGQPPKLALSQEKYVPAGSEVKREDAWQIPVCARYPVQGKNGTAISCTVLTSAQGELALSEAKACPAWVDANADDHGYYRVLYQGDLLTQLLARTKELTPAEKVALLADVGALVHTSKLSYADALGVAAKLAGDSNRDVVVRSMVLVSELRSADMVPESLRPAYARFVRDTYGARARQLGFKSRPGESDDVRLLRPELLMLVADEGEDPALAAEAKTLALGWLANKKGIEPDVLSPTLAIAARTGGDRALLDRMLAAARASTNNNERRYIVSAMGFFRDPALLRAALGVILDEGFDVRDTLWTVRHSQSMPATREIGYDFVKQNFDAIAARFPKDSSVFGGVSTIPHLFHQFCDDAHAADLESFFHDRVSRYTGGARALEQSVEDTKLCSAYRAIQAPSVSAFLQKKR